MTNDNSLKSIDMPEPDYNDPKEVYSYFGLAAYSIQVFEQGILNLLVGLKATNSATFSWENIEKLYNNGDRKTLGQLITEVKRIITFDSNLEEEISKALVKRNYLMHHFFVNHDISILTDLGKKEMINELNDSIISIKFVDSQVDDICHAIWAKYGITKEELKKDVDKLLYKLRKGENTHNMGKQ